MARNKLRQEIEQAIVKGIQRNAERVFDISQSTQKCYVPV